jgi:2'-5' RNA ligase
LKFFGNIDRSAVESICAAVKKQAAATPSLQLKAERMGVFPDLRKPRVLWVGTAGESGKLALLQNHLEADFEKIGFPRENRPFRAHLTLGRIKDSRTAVSIGEALKKHSEFTAGEFRVHEVILFQSNLTPQGAIYTKLAAIPLTD